MFLSKTRDKGPPPKSFCQFSFFQTWFLLVLTLERNPTAVPNALNLFFLAMCVEVAFESSYLYKFNNGWLCSKFFAHSSYLQKHLICHSGEKTYLCSQFPMLFLNSFNLNFVYCNSSLWRKTVQLLPVLKVICPVI